MKNFLNRIQIFPNMSKNQGNTKKREEAWKGKVTDVYMNDKDSQELLEKYSQTPVAVKESKI